MALVCHTILEDHMIQESCAFMGENPSWCVTRLPSLMVIGIVLVEIVCQMISQEHATKG